MAYAAALGAVALTGVGVQVPLPAPFETKSKVVELAEDALSCKLPPVLPLAYLPRI